MTKNLPRMFVLASVALNLLACSFLGTPAAEPPALEVASPSADTTIPVENTPTDESATPIVSTIEPTFTPTAEPIPTRWYWAANAEKAVFAVNQDGEVRELGNLPAYQKGYKAFAVDVERAVLFTDEGGQLHAYLLTLNGFQAIELPSLSVTDGFTSSSWAVPAVYGKYLAFAYTNIRGRSSGTSAQADSGPLVLINLETLTAEIVDKRVNRDAYTDAFDEIRTWAHLSDDGRYLRYLDGDPTPMTLRELDLATGEARTVYTAAKTQKTSRILGSLTGDLWAFRTDHALVDLQGNQTKMPDAPISLRPLRDGWAMSFSVECTDQCEIKVISPFSGKGEMTYILPWSTTVMYHNPLMNLLASDQSLIVSAAPLVQLTQTPVIVGDYPDFPQLDSPVFRLTSDGKARLIGFYALETSLDTIPASTDGRYLFLRAVDGSSYFVYDVREDRSIAEIPIDRTIKVEDYFGGVIQFFEHGFIAKISASMPEGTFRNSYLMYSFQTGESFYWESETEIFEFFQDILPDNTIICNRGDMNTSVSRLVRYAPQTQTSETLLENVKDVWGLIAAP